MILVFSTTATEADTLIELPSKLPEAIVDPGINKDVDNEAEINQYLTLAQLGNFLRELSVKGKNNKFHPEGYLTTAVDGN